MTNSEKVLSKQNTEDTLDSSSDSKNPVQPTIILTPMTVADIAEKARKQISEVILTLLKQGIIATKNQLLPEKVIAQLARIYGFKIAEKPVISGEKSDEYNTLQAVITQKGIWGNRLPVVVVIGHVDHGKTTLLDFIRKTRVAAREKGGITQHLGAYEVFTDHGNIVFLDTPGHEAFSMMRVRGLKVADITILVIAADDGVMPQTIEAIKRAQAAKLPIIVAINKIDKATPQQLEATKRQLAQYDLLLEEWGGSVIAVPISAKFGTGIAELLEIIALQSQLLELKANMSIPARGYVLESKLEKGRGPVATVIFQHGKLKIGDYFIAGQITGKVNSLVDSYGKRVQEALPSMPVQVSGFSQLPQAGDLFEAVTQEIAKKYNPMDQRETRSDVMLKSTEKEQTLNILIKSDNASSKEALISAIAKLNEKADKEIQVISATIGDISEGDINLATDTGAIIYGFHVKTYPNAAQAAIKAGVIIKHFDIIYKLLEDLEIATKAAQQIKLVTKKVGEASVIKTFDIKNIGTIAGAHIISGKFVKDGKVIIWRGKRKVGEGPIKGLQRERKAVKEVHTGFECAFLVDDFNEWQIDDRVECYQEVPV